MTLFEKFMDFPLAEKFSDFRDKLSTDEQQYIVDSDPSGKFKYADWIYKTIIIPARNANQPITKANPPVAELKSTLDILFSKIKGEMSDINIYESYEELADVVRKYKAEEHGRKFLGSGRITADMVGQDTPYADVDVDYTMNLINNRFGAQKFYHAPITSWCIATNYPHHYTRETRNNSMMFVAVKTSLVKPHDYLALRIAGNPKGGVYLESVWNNSNPNTSQDNIANQIGHKIFAQEKTKIEEAWAFHYSEANKPYIDYDASAEEGSYSDFIVKRMINARMHGRTVAGTEEFGDNFFGDNRDQVERIFTADPMLFAKYIKFLNPGKVEIEVDNHNGMPVLVTTLDYAKVKDMAEKIFRGGRHDTNWGEKLFNEGEIWETVKDWYWSGDYAPPLSDLLEMCDDRNTGNIHDIFMNNPHPEGSVVMVEGSDDEVDIEATIDLGEHPEAEEIKDSLGQSYNDAYADAGVIAVTDKVKAEVEDYLNIKLPEGWYPDKTAFPTYVCRIPVNTDTIVDTLSLVHDYYDFDYMDPSYARMHYRIENDGPATIDTDYLGDSPDRENFNSILHDRLPEAHKTPQRHIPQAPGQMDLFTDQPKKKRKRKR